MTAGLILWGHALAALGFALAAWGWLRRPVGRPALRLPMAAALLGTALWALAVAGIAAGDIVTRILEAIRNLAWLGVMLTLVRSDRRGGAGLYAIYAVTAAIVVFVASLALIQTLPLGAEASASIGQMRQVVRMLAAIAGLVLLHHLAYGANARMRGRIALLAVALAMLWGADLVTAASSWALGERPWSLLAVRGFVATAAALVMAMAGRRSERGLTVSHGIVLRLFSVAGVVGYAGATILLTHLAALYAGSNVRIAQTAIVLGSTTALMTMLSTPWLRGWAKVKVAKHFFRHRYDYRAEWQRFTTTLAVPGDSGAPDPLDRRIVRAMADLTASPGGLMLIPASEGLAPAAAWHWHGAGEGSALLAEHLASGRIISIDQVRRGDAPAVELTAIPDWMRDHDEAWALVPLIHGGTLVAAILLARPPIDRALDWEDLDLLRVAGRQAASYLAEDRAHAALADAARFDEFNRRFAFIIHDIKNMVSGLSLVARNAERHADNPAFRADMVETLKESAARMHALLARLSQHHRATPEPLQPVDVAALALRLAAGRRAQHPVSVDGAGVALAQPGRLEQLLGHLLQNAQEASAADAPIAIRVASEDDRVTVDVIDHGCGMSAAFVRDQLFRPFASSKDGGFGLGAFEARELAVAMGGTLGVTSREGEGTRFRLSLPRADAMEQAA